MHQDWIHLEHVGAWTDLTNRLAAVDDTDEFYEAEDLLEELNEPGVDPARDTLGLWDNDTMVGFGQLRLGEQLRDGRGRVSIGGGISPEYRRRGHGTLVMDVLEARAREKMAERHPGVDYTIDVWGNAPGHSAGEMAMARGYEPARFFQDMTLAPGDFLPHRHPASVPEDTVLVPYSPGIAEAVRVLDNEAFADHWGSAPKSADEWAAMTGARSFRSNYSRVLLEDHGENRPARALSHVLGAEWVAKELYISRVGTARAARGLGYAAWVLSTVVAAAFEDGFTKVDLSVDAQSPPGARGLYERLGFQLVRSGAVYRKTVTAR
ncbi:GNAT family N-acetyltransferase [Arthrobacter sp. AQ5-05]|uniref:GNAT family N-acetyltransferase n=1 Tax=Arthrobacter sp. AQ5-05 TaxID=2184581 RepID=UPI0015EB6074|nr:GNAT family N-acetyltransferase [Arthrobacter sp. AQ5-05]